VSRTLNEAAMQSLLERGAAQGVDVDSPARPFLDLLSVAVPVLRHVIMWWRTAFRERAPCIGALVQECFSPELVDFVIEQ